MDDIAFSDWPGQPVDLSGSNPWLPAYGYQQPAALLDKDDFIGNPDAALFLQGGTSPHYVFLETIVEETSDDLRSESDRSGSRCSPVGWLATDSESGSVIHVDLEGLDEIDSGSESEMACPAKRRRQDPNLLSTPCTYSDSDSNHSLSRSSSLLQFETLEKHCQDVYSSSPSILSLFSQDSLEQQRKTNDLSPDSLDRCHSDTESDSDYYKMLKIDVAPKSKRYRDSLFYTTKRLSDSDSKSDSDSQDSDETLQVASRSNSCRSVQNLKSCRSFDSLHVVKQKKEKMSAENLSEDSGYSDHLCNYMKNKSSSIPNMQVQGISIPEKSTGKTTNELKKQNGRSSTEDDINVYRLKNIKMCEGFDAYDAEPGYQSFASHFGSSYQDLTVFEKYEPLAGFRTPLIDRFMLNGAKKRGSSLKPDWCRHNHSAPQADVLNIGAPVECVAASKYSVLASASEPNLLQQAEASCDAGTALSEATYFYLNANTTTTTTDSCKSYFEGSVCVSSVPKDLNLAGETIPNCNTGVRTDEIWSQFTTNRTSIAEKNWDLADLPPDISNTSNCFNSSNSSNSSNTSNSSNNSNNSHNSNSSNSSEPEILKNESVVIIQPDISHLTDTLNNKMAAHIYRQEGSNVSAMLRQQRESSSVSGGSDISMPRYRREGSYVKAISEYLDISDITDDEREQSYQDPTDTSAKILDIESRIEKAISETSIQSFNDDTTKIKMLFHSTPINKRNVTSTPNLSAINTGVDGNFENSEIRRSMQNVPRKSSLIDRSASSSGMSEPEDKTITSKTFSGSGSTTKGVHFCPIVSEVSWRDSSSSSEDISSYSVSSTPHETTPEPVTPPVKPPRYDMKTPPRKSSSQPELPKNVENETEYIFIPLNPAKWASSTPSMSQSSASNEMSLKVNQQLLQATQYQHQHQYRQRQQQQQQQQQQQEKRPPTSSGSHVVSRHNETRAQAQQLHEPQRQQKAAVVLSSVAPMEPTVLQVQRPVSAPTPTPTPKQTRTNKLGGFLSRFASFRFSNRKSNEEKNKKKAGSLNTDVTKKNPQTTTPTTTSANIQQNATDYIYIPLKGPLPPSLAAREINGGTRNGNQVFVNDSVTATTTTRTTVVNNNNVESPCISAKPPLPKMPPRVVSACVKTAAPSRRTHIDSGVAAVSLSRNRNACSMEPMGLIETDLDTEVTVITAGSGAGAHVKTRSLMNLGGAEPPHRGANRALLAANEAPDRPHKSMEFLLDKQNLKAVEPPENELQKGTGERVMSEHQLRVQRSLQKLTVPEWYKANQVPREGFILKKQRNESRWTGTGTGTGSSTTNNSKTPSLSSLGSGHSPILLSPQPHAQQPFTRWSTSKLNSAASSPCASTRSSFNHRTSNGGISPCSVRSSFSYRQPYLGWRSQERLTRPRTPAERLATSLLPPLNADNHHVVDRAENPEIQTSIKEVTSAIVHYCGLKPEQGDRNSLSPTASPRFERDASPRLRHYVGENADNASQRSTSPQSRGSQKLCWLESSFVGTRPLDSPQTPVSLNPPDSAASCHADSEQPLIPPTTLRLDLQKNINTGESLRA